MFFFSLNKASSTAYSGAVLSRDYSPVNMLQCRPPTVVSHNWIENTCFVCNSMGNGPVEGAITSILKNLKVYYSKTHLNFFLIFAENVWLLSQNMIKLIPLGPQSQSIKSPLSTCNYTRVYMVLNSWATSMEQCCFFCIGTDAVNYVIEYCNSGHRDFAMLSCSLMLIGYAIFGATFNLVTRIGLPVFWNTEKW